MANFERILLKRQVFAYISALDPGIDWANSSVTKKEYAKDPMRHKSSLAHHSKPIIFMLKPQTEEQSQLAMGLSGLDFKEKIEGSDKLTLTGSGSKQVGEHFALAVGYTKSQRLLAKMCIVGMENFDAWPDDLPIEQAFIQKGYMPRQLAPCISDRIPRQILSEIGDFLLEQGRLDEEKKEQSTSADGGGKPLKNTDTPTIAPSVESQPKQEKAGDAMDPQSPTSLEQDWSTNSDPTES